MAGIYIHIPFCRQACRYCDFHFVVSVWHRKDLIPLLIREINERKEYLGDETIETIYFGGGTPSVMERSEINKILECIHAGYSVSGEAEISFEANPEDLNKEYIDGLRKSGINRLSIGIQSFQDRDLELMHRIHNSEQAVRAVRDSQDAGFDNISIDLIYGIPRQEPGSWEKNLETALSLETRHFSAYHLTYEPGTVFDHWRKKGRLMPVSEENSLEQFRVLISSLEKGGYEHYEISNFALPGFRSKHNSSYWTQQNYLGIGPSAHSFNGIGRQWNVSDNRQYSEKMLSGSEYYETEILSAADRFNEYVMTSLRMKSGLDISKVKNDFGEEATKHFIKEVEKYIKSSHVFTDGNMYKLSPEGIFISDHIISGLFMDGEN